MWTELIETADRMQRTKQKFAFEKARVPVHIAEPAVHVKRNLIVSNA